MENVSSKMEGNSLVILLSGHVDTNNAKQVEEEIQKIISANSHENVIVDAADLEYISSAGLRVVLRLRKLCPSLKVINVSSEVYEVFDMTGFTEMIPIEKAYKQISVDGCEVIGEGANGKVYRIDAETIVKAYKNPDSLDDILNERKLAKKAFVLGIPTAISYEIVRIGDGYGSVFEKLTALSLAKLTKENPDKVDEYVKYSVDLLKLIHHTTIETGEMPPIKPTILKWVNRLENTLPEATLQKLRSLVEAVEDKHTVLHGDYHFKNVMYEDGETLLIDMDTLCTGHPIFEFASIYNAYVGFGCVDKSKVENFLNLPYELTNHIWDKTLELYFDTTDSEYLNNITDKAKLIGYTRITQRAIRRNENPALIEFCTKQIIELTEKLDTLEF